MERNFRVMTTKLVECGGSLSVEPVVYAYAETIEGAIRGVKQVKRQGKAAWVEDMRGKHVPVPGAKGDPGRYYGKGSRKNPEADTKEAERLYKIFYQFEPRKVGAFASGFSIPRRATHVGEAKTMYYTSDKLNPTTGEDEGAQRYYHPHEGDVYMLVTDKGAQGHVVEVPRWIHGVDSLVLLGQCDGFEYEDFDGDLQEAQATGRKPEWYCIPSGKALLVVQDKKKVLAIVYGGSLDVEWRGVVG